MSKRTVKPEEIVEHLGLPSGFEKMSTLDISANINKYQGKLFRKAIERRIVFSFKIR